MGDMEEGRMGGPAKARAPTGGYGSIYGYMTQEYKAAPSRSAAVAVIAVVVIVAAIAYVVMRMRETPTGF